MTPNNSVIENLLKFIQQSGDRLRLVYDKVSIILLMLLFRDNLRALKGVINDFRKH